MTMTAATTAAAGTIATTSTTAATRAAAALSAPTLARRDSAFGDREQDLAREANLAGLVDFDDSHFDLVAFLHVVGDDVHALVRDLGDVEQAVLIREHADEGAEIDDLL